MNVEPLEPKTDDFIRKNKKGKYLLDDSEINENQVMHADIVFTT